MCLIIYLFFYIHFEFCFPKKNITFFLPFCTKIYKKVVESGIEETIVNSTYNRIRINEFKRRQAAPGLRVSSKAFGMGRRFPIVNHFKSESL